MYRFLNDNNKVWNEVKELEGKYVRVSAKMLSHPHKIWGCSRAEDKESDVQVIGEYMKVGG